MDVNSVSQEAPGMEREVRRGREGSQCAIEQISILATEAQSWGALGNSVKRASVIPMER